MKRIEVILSFCVIAFGSAAFGKSEGAERFIKNLRGCFSVSFKYIEDGKNNQTIDGLYEWVVPVDGDPTSLQHMGIVQGKAFKHWHEEWRETPNGNWSQKVTGPFGDFRYECAAPIVFFQWQCAVSKAPKPRRDKDRTDYATLDRENTLQVTPEGYVQAENNLKRDQDGKPVSNELGWNEYRRVDEKYCQEAKDYLAHK